MSVEEVVHKLLNKAYCKSELIRMLNTLVYFEIKKYKEENGINTDN